MTTTSGGITAQVLFVSIAAEKQAESFTVCCEICSIPIFNLPDVEKNTLAKSANEYKVFCTPCFERRYL